MAETTEVKKYDSSISLNKGKIGAVDGTLAGAVTVLVVGLVKSMIKDMDQNMENVLALVVGTVVSAAIVAAKRYFDNWMKNKGLGAVVAPVAPADPVADQPTTQDQPAAK